VKIHCSVLAEDAIRAAIGDWRKKNGVAETAESAPATEEAADPQA
jgi:nitrogen fixation NifU-like protein